MAVSVMSTRDPEAGGVVALLDELAALRALIAERMRQDAERVPRA